MPAFDDLTDVYEAMIDWPRRLAHEEPFYREWFGRVGAKRVLDAACGTGRHAAMFHSWGLEVEAADISAGMLERARETFGEPTGLRWVQRSFDGTPGGAFDAVVCVGNSLALVEDEAAVERAVRALLSAVRPGGVLILHVLNVWKLPDGPCVWQKAKRAALAGAEALILKGVHRCGGRAFVELAVLGLDGSMRSESVPFLGLEGATLEDCCRVAGAREAHLFGGYSDHAYHREASQDLVVVARR